jgi:hypothetical protein
VKAALPAGELEFDGQAVHVELAEDPTAVEYVPAAQSEQVAVPVNALYFPSSHGVHGPPSGPQYPALQVQVELIAGELEPCEHGRHVDAAEAPPTVEYVSALHPLHGPVPGNALYDPALHALQTFATK